MVETRNRRKQLLRGPAPPNLNLVTNTYYASYCGRENFNKTKHNTSTTLSNLGKNKFLQYYIAIPFPRNGGVIEL